MNKKVFMVVTFSLASFFNLAQANDQTSEVNFDKQQQQIEALQRALSKLTLEVSTARNNKVSDYSPNKNW